MKNRNVLYVNTIRSTRDLPFIFREVFWLCKNYPHHTVIFNCDQGSGSEIMNCRSTDYVEGVKDLYRMLPFSEWWFDNIQDYTRKSTMYREIRKGLRHLITGGFELKIAIVEKV